MRPCPQMLMNKRKCDDDAIALVSIDDNHNIT